MTTMDLQSLETFLTTKKGLATEAANEHLSEKARHDELATQNKQDAIWLERQAVRVRGLRDSFEDGPSWLSIAIRIDVEDRSQRAVAATEMDDGADGSSDGSDVRGIRDAAPDVWTTDSAGRDDESTAAPDAGRPTSETHDASRHASEAPSSDADQEAEAPALTPEPSPDDAFLRTMRFHRESDGICRLKAMDVGNLCGLPKNTVGVIVARLVRAGSLIAIPEGSRKVYRVASEDGSFVPLAKTLATPAPVQRAGPPTPRAPSELEEQVLAHIRLCVEKSGEDSVLLGKDWLMKRFERKEWMPFDVAFANLASRGLIIREKGIADHVRFSLVDQSAEKAA